MSEFRVLVGRGVAYPEVVTPRWGRGLIMGDPILANVNRPSASGAFRSRCHISISGRDSPPCSINTAGTAHRSVSGNKSLNDDELTHRRPSRSFRASRYSGEW